MITKVGMQRSFSDATKDLLELEYDMVETYEYAIGLLETEEYKQKLTEFSLDHRRHVEEISKLLDAHDIDFDSGPDAKQWVAKGKVALYDLFGDANLLRAMNSNENDSVTAYERMNKYHDVWEDAREIMESGLADERKHNDWLEKTIS